MDRYVNRVMAISRTDLVLRSMEQEEMSMSSQHRVIGRGVASVVQIASLTVFVALALVAPFLPTARAAATWNVSVVDFAFQPSSLPIQPGDKVNWTNNGAVDHQIIWDTPGPADSPVLAPGNSYEWTFSTVGVFNYHCFFHPASMIASVTVGAIPEFSNVAFVMLGLLVLMLSMIAVRRKF